MKTNFKTGDKIIWTTNGEDHFRTIHSFSAERAYIKEFGYHVKIDELRLNNEKDKYAI